MDGRVRGITRAGVLTIAALCAAWTAPSAAAAASPSPSKRPLTGPAQAAPAAVPGEVIVRFEPSARRSDRSRARRSAGVSLRRALRVPGAQLLEVDRGQTARGAIAALERDPSVRYAERNWSLHATARTPDDLFFGHLWGLHNAGQLVDGFAGTPDADIDAPEAWDIATGGRDVVVAVADTGVDYVHPDLAANGWVNAGEIAGNAVDDDGNGFVDDRRGWDTIDGDGDPQDLNGHGTHVAGTIAAQGNNGIGVTGVAWAARVMPVRVLDADGSGSTATVADGFHYAGMEGARVVNASLGGGAPASEVQIIADAVNAHPDTLFVAAAGNGGDDFIGDDNDATPQYPCNIAAANVLCVAATDSEDGLAPFSNYGAASVDLGAPGVSIGSTWPDSQYVFLDGTSMATPHVAGAATLVRAAAPCAGIADLRAWLVGTGDAKASLTHTTASGRRLNLNGAMQAMRGVPTAPVATVSSAAAVTRTAATLRGAVDPAGSAATYRFEFRPAGGAWRQTGQLAAERLRCGAAVSAPVSGLTAGTDHEFRVVATNAVGTTVSPVGRFRTAAPPPPPPSDTTPGDSGDGGGDTTEPPAPIEPARLVRCALKGGRLKCRARAAAPGRARVKLVRRGRVHARGSADPVTEGAKVRMNVLRKLRRGRAYRLKVVLVAPDGTKQAGSRRIRL